MDRKKIRFIYPAPFALFIYLQVHYLLSDPPIKEEYKL